jgi:hypothetical protein
MISDVLAAQLSLLLFIGVTALVYVVNPIQNYEKNTTDYIQKFIESKKRRMKKQRQ